MKCTSTEDICDKLKSIYEGDEKVKNTKLQTYSMQFETLHEMKEEEYIAPYFIQVDEIVNSIKGLGETIEEDSVVQKILRTFPPHFNSKVSVLKDRTNLDDLTKDELHEILIVYEIRTEK